MGATTLTLDEAAELTRTGDLWIFRGRSGMDRAIQMTTNSPVNHVGMAVVLEDLPPLMWHAELGRSLRDVWSGNHHRGVQLHDLREAVVAWGTRYGQRAWLRQLEPAVGRDAEDAVLRTIARLDGTPFPSTARLAGRWFAGRVPIPRSAGRGGPAEGRGGRAEAGLESAYCAEVVAVTFEAMGLLPAGRRPNWYDPGRFWSGDDLPLTAGFRLGDEIAVELPADLTTPPAPASPGEPPDPTDPRSPSDPHSPTDSSARLLRKIRAGRWPRWPGPQ